MFVNTVMKYMKLLEYLLYMILLFSPLSTFCPTPSLPPLFFLSFRPSRILFFSSCFPLNVHLSLLSIHGRSNWSVFLHLQSNVAEKLFNSYGFKFLCVFFFFRFFFSPSIIMAWKFTWEACFSTCACTVDICVYIHV